ncbi:hypothetical protein Tco_1545970 [Tanacetum coccineum]
MASNPENVRLTVLMKLQEALDEEAILEEQILALMHRFADSGAAVGSGGEHEQVLASADGEKQQVPTMMREGVVSGDGDWRKGERDREIKKDKE